MCLLLIVLCCFALSVACAGRNLASHNSRFGESYSRLGRCEFPVRLRRELAGKPLIRLGIRAATPCFSSKIEKIPGSTGKTGNWAAGGRPFKGRLRPAAASSPPSARRAEPAPPSPHTAVAPRAPGRGARRAPALGLYGESRLAAGRS